MVWIIVICGDICGFLIIKTADLKKLDKNIASLFCSWNKIAHCKVSRFCSRYLYFNSNSFHCNTSVCACVCVCVFPSTANDFSCLNWCQAPTLMYMLAILCCRHLLAYFRKISPHLCLHLQNSEIPTQLPTGIKITGIINEWKIN